MILNKFRRILKERKLEERPWVTLDDIVLEYFDAGECDVLALADALALTPIELYKSVRREEDKIRAWIPREYRLEVERIRWERYASQRSTLECL